MKPLFSRVAVLGLGLLGGSVAAAARARGVAGHVVGHGRRRAPLERALAAGLVDSIVDGNEGAARAVRGADLVILAPPVSSMCSLLEAAAPGLADGVLVTDVGSVKAPLAERLPGLLPAGAVYVGSHPMAGSHEIGVDHARADLLQGACCVVTPPPGVDPATCERLVAFWRALGSVVVCRDPQVHDSEVAWVSHLPHVLAFAYARALDDAPLSAGELAGSGFRDFVRIARSDSELWGDILGLNHKALAGPLRAFSEALGELARAIEAQDNGGIAARERILSAAARRLDSISPANSLASSGVSAQTGARPKPAEPAGGNESTDCARSGGENPEIQAAPRAAATRSINRNS